MQFPQAGRFVGWLMLVGCFLSMPEQSHAEAKLPDGVVLTKSSMPDFIVADMRAMNEKLRGDLQPQENAVVWLLQAIGTECLGPELQEPTLQMLGVERFSSKGPELEKLETFGRRRQKLGSDYAKESVQFNDGLNLGPLRAWKREEFESLAIYLEENAAALELIAAAVQQRGYYWPLISSDTPQRIISASYGIELRLQFAAKLIAARANLRIEEGNIDGAFEDIRTLHQLAVIMSRGSPFDVTVVKAHLIDSYAASSEKALLESGKLTGAKAKEYQKQLSETPRILPAAKIANLGERAIIREEIALTKLNTEELKSMFEDPKEEKEADPKGKPKPPRPIPKIDWELAIKRGEEIQDRVQQALATQDRAAQSALFDALDKEYTDWDNNLDETTARMIEDLQKKNDLAGASRYLGESMARALRTHYRQRQATDDRANSRRNQVLLGLALIAYQRDKGEFPQQLSDLSPAYLDQIPSDPNSNKPFTYERNSADQARIIGWGSNGNDDAGKPVNDDQIFQLR